MTTLKQFRWFWAWDDEKEEKWLRDMAKKGWHFTSVSLPGNYYFEQGEPKIMSSALTTSPSARIS